MTVKRRLLASMVALVAAVSCSQEAATDGDGSGGRPSSTARIEILEPEPGASLPAEDVLVRVSLTGATLVEEATTEIRPDEGHIHLKVDGETITLLGGLEEEVPDLEPGLHVLEVEFAAGDHGPFDPPVIQSQQFTVE
jgi:hypothetical protein